MTYKSIKALNRMEQKQRYDSALLRRKRNAVIAGLIISFCIGMATMWLTMSDQIDQAADNARQSERTAILSTLMACARTNNLYQIPGTEITFEAKIHPRGLKIVDVKKARELARQSGQ